MKKENILRLIPSIIGSIAFLAVGIYYLKNSEFLGVRDALDYNLINTDGFFSFYKDTTGVDLNSYLNSYGKIDEYSFARLGIFSDLDVHKKFCDIYHDYINTFTDKTPEMQKFMEKFAAWKNNDKLLGISNRYDVRGIILVFIGALFATFVVVALAVNCMSKKNENIQVNIVHHGLFARAFVSNDDCSRLQVDINVSRVESELPLPNCNEAIKAQQNSDLPPPYGASSPSCDYSNQEKKPFNHGPNQNVRVEDGFFSGLGKRVKAVLLLDDDAIEERVYNGQNWVQHVLGMRGNGGFIHPTQ